MYRAQKKFVQKVYVKFFTIDLHLEFLGVN